MAEQMLRIDRATGISGMSLTLTDFVPGVRDFGEKILPIIRADQVRQADAVD